MKIPGEIVLIDKDDFENDFFKEILKRLLLSVEIKHFKTPEAGLEYLKKATSKIFVVLSLVDFGVPFMSGLELKEKINENEELLFKAIPFIFMSYLDDNETIKQAYKLNIQGYFKKPMTLEDSTILLASVFNYWTFNLRPGEGV